MAQREQLKFLGALPVDTELVTLLDNEVLSANAEGNDGVREDVVAPSLDTQFALLERYKRTPSFQLFQAMADKILVELPPSLEPTRMV